MCARAHRMFTSLYVSIDVPSYPPSWGLRAVGPAQPVQPFWLDVTILVLCPVIWQYVVGGRYVRMVTKGGRAYSKNVLIRALLVRTSATCRMEFLDAYDRTYHLAPCPFFSVTGVHTHSTVRMRACCESPAMIVPNRHARMHAGAHLRSLILIPRTHEQNRTCLLTTYVATYVRS